LKANDFSVDCIERNSILPSLTMGSLGAASDKFTTSDAPAIRYDDGINRSNEMNWRHRVLTIAALSLLTGLGTSAARAQARIGEAAVVKNEVVRVSESAATQTNVGDGVLRDEVLRTGLDSLEGRDLRDDGRRGPSSSIAPLTDILDSAGGMKARSCMTLFDVVSLHDICGGHRGLLSRRQRPCDVRDRTVKHRKRERKPNGGSGPITLGRRKTVLLRRHEGHGSPSS
jgi:hypothetical protein